MNQPTTAAAPASTAALVNTRRKLRNFVLDPGL